MKSNKWFNRLFSNWHVKVFSFVAALVLFQVNRINNLEEFTLQVPLKVITSENYAVSAPYTNTIALTIRGDRQLNIKSLTPDDFLVQANISKKNPGTFVKPSDVAILYEKQNRALNLEPIEVTLMPAVVSLQIEKRMDKKVKIEPNIDRLKIADGFVLSSSRFNPREVIISGPESRVKNIDFLKTEPIILDQQNKDFYIIIKALSPDGLVEIKDSSSVEYTGLVEEIYTVKRLENLKIKVINVSPSLVAGKLIASGSVNIKAPGYVLRRLKPDEIELRVNGSNIKRAGKYTLKVEPIIPGDVRLIFYEPRELLVDFNYK